MAESLEAPHSEGSVPDLTDLRCTEAAGLPDSPNPGTQVFVPQEPKPVLHTIVDQNRPVKAMTDLVLIQDQRVVQNLIKAEDSYLPSNPDYFRYVQNELTPSMRKIVADWMLQVCQEVNSQPEVFCLAMNYMDRFLARCRVRKSHLQLVGSVCLLISSKFMETCPIPGEKLIYYTDFSITPQDIKDWELLVLNELGWELSSVTPLDFIDHIIAKIDPHQESNIVDLRRRIETILVLAVTEYSFTYLSPSLLATTAVLISLQYLRQENRLLRTKDGADIVEIRRRVVSVSQSHQDDIFICSELMCQLLPRELITPLPGEPSQTKLSEPCPSQSDSVSLASTPTTTTTTSDYVEDFSPVTSELKPDSFSILVS